MQSRPTLGTYLIVTGLLTLVAAGFAGFVSLTASWMHVSGVTFLPIFVVYALLYVPAGTKRLAEAFAVGPAARSHLMGLRDKYTAAVLEHPELRAWPETTTACLMAASALLVRASLRAWLVMLTAILFFRLVGSEMGPDLRPMWLTLTFLEACFLGSRAYRRGTLPLAGMGADEMETYCQDRLSRVDRLVPFS